MTAELLWATRQHEPHVRLLRRWLRENGQAVRRRIAIVAAATLSAAIVTAGAFGHVGATGVVAQRMDLMETMGDAMRSLTAMMRGEAPYDAERVRSLARSIGNQGGAALTDLFPEGSLDHPTEALPTIWADWEHFSSLADQVSASSFALESAAGNERAGPSGDSAPGDGGLLTGGLAGPTAEQLAELPPNAAFRQLAQACSACHQHFRMEQ